MSAPKKDPVENIRELYEEDTRAIPYPVFMRCFDALLEDPPDPHPAPPSDNLKPYLRAVCMALDLGIGDQQDRGADRREEFYEYILPAWEEALSDAGMKAFREILDGKVRKRMESLRHEEQKQKAEQRQRELEEASISSAEDRQSRFSQAMKDALCEAKRTGQDVLEQEPDISDKRGEEGDRSEENGRQLNLDKSNTIPMADNIKKILEAIKAGEIAIEYNSPRARAPLAKYSFGGQLITLLLVQKKGNYFVLLEADNPDKETPSAKETLREVAEDMSYEQRDDCSYERQIGGASLKIQLGRKGSYLVCRRPRKLNADELAKTVHHLHKNFSRFLASLSSFHPESDDD